MPTKVAGKPYPHEVWLSVHFTDLTPTQRELIKTQLQRMRGWRTSFADSYKATLRYGHTPGRLAEVMLHAHDLLRKSGARAPQVGGFVIWRVDLNFAKPRNMWLFKYMAEAMKALPQVLDVHAIGDNRTGVYVEFQGEPTDDLMRRVQRLATTPPHPAK